MQHSRNSFEVLARFGYAARGVVYLLLGGLALFSGGWGADSSEGAIATLLSQPFGRILLAAMSAGLFGFAAWRVAQGAFNADRRDENLKNTIARVGKMVSAGAYVSLGVFAGGLAMGLTGGNSGQTSQQSWTATVLAWPFGPFLVGTVGMGVVLGGVGNIWKAFSGAFQKRLSIPGHLEKGLAALCTYGIAARGLVFVILGGFIFYAAISIRPEEAGSVGDALDWVRSLPFGGVLYVVVAAGLLAFAACCAVYALYRRVKSPDTGELGNAARQAAKAVQTIAPKAS
jgi:hypothetical protein